MKACVYNTNSEWLNHLRSNRLLDGVNFWRKDLRELHLSPGSPFYFKVYRAQKIAGRGLFRVQATMKISEAWEKFGLGNGVDSLAEFESRAREVLSLAPSNHTINCLILDDVSILQEEDYPSLQQGQFPPSIMGAKYFDPVELATLEEVIGRLSNRIPSDGIRTLTIADELDHSNYFNPKSLVDSREKTLREISQRRGQTKFRNLLLKAYAGQCAVSSTLLPDVLEAAHIVPYLGTATNRLDNGLLLRSDWHTLFDLGAWTLSDDFRIMIRPSLRSTEYGAYEGKEIKVPDNPKHRPSMEAVRCHRSWASQRTGSIISPFNTKQK